MVTAKTKVLDLSFNHTKFNESGIEDFYWPVKISETRAYRSHLFNELADFLQVLRADNKEVSQCIEVLTPKFINLSINMFQAALLYSKASTDSYTIELGQRYSLLKYLKTENYLFEDPYVSCLERGPAPLNRWRLPLRFTRDILMSHCEGISRRTLRTVNYKDDVITSTTQPLVQAWRKRFGSQRVIFKRDNAFFHPLSGVDESLSDTEREWLGKLALLNEKMFRHFNLSCPAVFTRYITEVLEKSICRIRTHIALLKKRNDLPLNLWSNTGGSPWSRMLAIVVRERGGFVTSFDHAGGHAYSHICDLDYINFVEFLTCDRFVTFSKKQAGRLETVCRKDLCKVEFDHVQDKSVRCSVGSASNIQSSHAKKILFFITIYPCERVDCAADFMSNQTAVDWQIRLSSFLKELGYDVILKPHPESPVKMPQYFEKDLGIKISYESFESAVNEADYLLCDYVASTTFRTACMSNKPMILVDFGLKKLSDEAERSLSKRCSILKGYFDQNNRAMIDWEKLVPAIQTSVSKKGKEFIVDYFL